MSILSLLPENWFNFHKVKSTSLFLYSFLMAHLLVHQFQNIIRKSISIFIFLSLPINAHILYIYVCVCMYMYSSVTIFHSYGIFLCVNKEKIVYFFTNWWSPLQYHLKYCPIITCNIWKYHKHMEFLFGLLFGLFHDENWKPK